MRLEKETFGPVLRAARQRRGVTLAQIAGETKLGLELWEALEENNLSRWPRQIYARSYVRDYATRVGLDADEVVNEFCRLFPEWGERRAERTLRHHAEIVGHRLEWADLPSLELKRASDRSAGTAPGLLARHRTRILAAVVDLKMMLGLAGVGVLLDFAFWPSLAVGALGYTLVATVFAGRTFGAIASEWLIKAARLLPAARRIVSSGAGGA